MKSGSRDVYTPFTCFPYTFDLFTGKVRLPAHSNTIASHRVQLNFRQIVNVEWSGDDSDFPRRPRSQRKEIRRRVGNFQRLPHAAHFFLSNFVVRSWRMRDAEEDGC